MYQEEEQNIERQDSHGEDCGCGGHGHHHGYGMHREWRMKC